MTCTTSEDCHDAARFNGAEQCSDTIVVRLGSASVARLWPHYERYVDCDLSGCENVSWGWCEAWGHPVCCHAWWRCMCLGGAT